ncbi:MAG TPA: hypothetical protein VFU46_10735 [Gemmatimonadales bacterium]|nr:hypothetical protein [Gemmatimonadales bacterium]
MATGARVTFGASGRLVPLFARAFPGVEVADADLLAGSTADAGRFDYQIALGSLPRAFRRSLEAFPARAGYLLPDPARIAPWRERVPALGPGLKVGISWRSQLLTAEREKYYTSLDQWGPILQTPGVRFVNLQYDDCTLALAAERGGEGLAARHQLPDSRLVVRSGAGLAIRSAGELQLGFGDLDPDERHGHLRTNTSRRPHLAGCGLYSPRNCSGSRRRGAATPTLTTGLEDLRRNELSLPRY